MAPRGVAHRGQARPCGQAARLDAGGKPARQFRILLDRLQRLGETRVCGILAAGALYALQNHRERIKDDHAKARRFAERGRQQRGAPEAVPDPLLERRVIAGPGQGSNFLKTTEALAPPNPKVFDSAFRTATRRAVFGT